jgi:YidC/Oxa1 family membrane protein insertase
VEKRALLATLICMGIFVLWTMVISPKVWPPPKPVPPKKPEPAAATPKPTPTPTPTPVQPLPTPVTPPGAKGAEFPAAPPIAITTKTLKVEFTNSGAGIRSLIARYPDEAHDVPMLLPREPHPHFALRQVDGPEKLESIPWKIEERRGDELVEFSYPLANGLEIRKTFRIDPDRYTLKMTVELRPPKGEEGKPPVERTVQLEFLAFNGLEHESPYRYEQYFHGVALVGDDVKTWELGSIEKAEGKLLEASRMPLGPDRDAKVKEAYEGLTVPDTAKAWIGLRNRFFATLANPDPQTAARIQYRWFRFQSSEAMRSAGGLKNLDVVFRTAPIKVTDRPTVLSFDGYAGPIQKEALTQMPEASRLLYYGSGCFLPIGGLTNMVGQVILAILKFFHGLLGNWGLGIIATTLLIRICIFPLSKKSQKSAYQMQQLAPKIQVLRERYKDDQQKFGMEQMRLYREHKINPLSGCLPLFLQLPIFIGMFSVFDTSIELRGQPFFGWIVDLSRPDRLVSWKTPIDVPLLPTFDSLNLLPILMLITWFLQAYFAPRSPDPQMQQQQKMMLAMPIVFGLMCYNYAAGLSLYFLVNSGLAMIEQKIIKKYILKMGQAPKPPEGQATSGGQGSPGTV